MAKKAKPLWSGPWMELRYGKQTWCGDGEAGWFDLCHLELAGFFDIPPQAIRIRVHLYSGKANQECVRFYLWQSSYGNVHYRRSRCHLAYRTSRNLIEAPLGWKDGEATVWADIEYK